MSTGGLRKSFYSESLGFIGTCVSQKKSLGHMCQKTPINKPQNSHKCTISPLLPRTRGNLITDTGSDTCHPLAGQKWATNLFVTHRWVSNHVVTHLRGKSGQQIKISILPITNRPALCNFCHFCQLVKSRSSPSCRRFDRYDFLFYQKIYHTL